MIKLVKISDKEFKYLQKLVYKKLGLHLKDSKKNMINARFQSIIEREEYDNYSEYFNQILKSKNSEDFNEFLHKVTTHHSFFNRENKHYQVLMKRILPWIKQNKFNYDIRIWSAGCSTGEEAYTISFYLEDFFSHSQWNKKILATDISLEALEQASKGVYFKKNIEKLPKKFIKRYFKKNGEMYKIKERIRKEVIFRKFNLMDEFPFKKKFQVIFCRNVMIYFKPEVRKKVIQKFEKHLVKGGFFIIGSTESITHYTNHNLKMIWPSVYRKV